MLTLISGTAYFNEIDFNKIKNFVEWYAIQKDNGVFFTTKEATKEAIKENIKNLLYSLNLNNVKYHIIWDFAKETNNPLYPLGEYVGEREEIN